MRKMLLASAAAFVATASVSSAATIVFQTGFEAPDYSIGNLIGQNNWSQYDADVPNANVTVQSGVVRPITGGSQAVRFQATGAGIDPYYDFTDVLSTDSAVPASLIAAEPIVRIQWDMMRAPLGGGESPTGSWGIDIYDTNANNLTATISVYDDMIGPGVSGTDDSLSQVYLGDGSARGTWDTYMVEMNYLTRTYTVLLNGMQIGDAQAINAAADNGIGDVDFLSWTRGTDSAYFDNFSITTNSVPEPGMISAFAIGGMMLRRRARRA
ncbi:hypothetical protein BH09PLA1_BH09PLA1_13590 [soil metagenome]